MLRATATDSQPLSVGLDEETSELFNVTYTAPT